MTKDKWEKVETSPTWDFTIERELIGTYVSAETNVGPNKSNLYTFKREDGELISVWGNTILDSRFKNLEEGDKVKIVYEGQKPSQKRPGKFFHSFEVYRSKSENDLGDGEIPVIEE